MTASELAAPADPLSGRRPLAGARIGYAVIMLAAILLVWASIGVHLWQEYSRASDGVEQDTGNLTSGLAASVASTLDAVDQTLIYIRESYARDPVGFDLARWTRNGPVVGNMAFRFAVIDATGEVHGAALGGAAGRRDLAQSDLVRTQQGSGEDRMNIGLPTRNASGTWTLDITRKIVMPGGAYGGVVVCTMDVDVLSRLYDRLDLGATTVQVIGTDGAVRARYPATDLSQFRRLQPALVEQLFGGQGHHVFTHVSPFDGVARMGSSDYVAEYGLIVVASMTVDDVFLPIRRHFYQLAGAGVVLTALIFAVGLTMRSQHRRLTGSRTVLSATLDNIGQGIIMIDATGAVPVLNRRAIELLGLPETLLQPRPRFADIVRWQVEQGEFGPPDKVNDTIRRTLESGVPNLQSGLFERQRPNGVVLEIRTDTTANGNFVRTYTDVTERRRTETALSAARDAAEAASRARSEFLAVMSHEIRTPMNGINGVAELLLGMQLPATEQHYVRIIYESGKHLLDLINDILDFSRLDAGRLDLEETEFDIRGLLREVVELLGQEARAKGLALDADVSDDVPLRAIGDPHRLRQVLLNLVGNGLKFTNQGSVRITVRALGTDAGGVLHLGFTVVDTGIGIRADALGRLFTEFTQVDSSISRRFGGSGLGLAISRRLIERMGGTVGVESTEGIGSTFRFDVRLRGAAVPVARPALAPPLAAPAGAGLSVLVAEDNATNRLVITRMLERLGHQVEAVENGREAVAAVQARRFDFIVMDVMMPELDGLAATKAIRAMAGPAAAIPIIGLTANAMRADETKCIAAGMTRFETKPINSDRLAEAIRQVISATPGSAAGRPAPDFPRFDPARLDELVAEIGPAATLEVVRLFCEDSLAQVATMGDLAESGRLELLAHNARVLVRAAENVGLMRLSAAVTTLQDDIADGAPERLREHVRQIGLILRNAMEELRAWRPRGVWQGAAAAPLADDPASAGRL
jgi:signal transduction histidine kinase/DNA-binding response OmpR family regulator